MSQWLLWLILGACVVALVALVVQLRRPYRRPLRRRARSLKPIPVAEFQCRWPEPERRTHPRVSDWEDRLRDDRRIT